MRKTDLHEPKSYLGIMVSSTFTDLKKHRQQVIKAIEAHGFRANVMENDGARDDVDVIDSSLNMVRDSVAYIGVISLKYGQTPFCADRNPDRLSITELEFNEAMRLNRPILLFVMADNHEVVKADIELDPVKAKKLDAFRERAKLMRDGGEVNRVYQVFDSLQQFSTDAATAVGRLVRNIELRAVSKPLVLASADSGSPGSAGAVSNIPINVPLHFLGRDEDLIAIAAALGRNQGRVAITTLHGMRGVGKTALAATFGVRHHANYRAIWWLRAQTEPTLRTDLVALGVKLGWVVADEKEEPALKAVTERLECDGEGILLIFDNANNAEELKSYLPRGNGVHVLVTSNDSVWGKIATKIEIKTWPKEVGADYLVVRTGRDGERDAALALSEALGGLPLAHEQAAAYCERIGISLAEYLRRFEATPTILLDIEKDAPAEYHDRMTVAKTFALAIDEAAKLHPAAESLIVYAALLAPESIPLFLFSEQRVKLGEPLASAIGDGGLDEAVAALRAFALVDREIILDERDQSIATDCIRLHRLVRQVAAGKFDDDARENVRRQLIEAMTAAYPSKVHTDPKTWPRARRLDSLAMALVAPDDNLPEGSERAAANLLGKLDSYRDGALAAYAEARKLSERALAIREKALGADHPDTANSLNNLGYLLQAQGDLAGARPYYDRALAIREKALGADHPDTANSLNNLGYLLQAQGDLAGARPYYDRALAITEKALGPDHPDTASSLNNLGALLDSQGDLAGARPYYDRALAIREKALGPDHPDTATSLNNLGYLLRAQGDLAGARQYYDRALAICDKALGAAHPSTKIVAGNTAGLLDALKCRKEAEALREKFGI